MRIDGAVRETTSAFVPLRSDLAARGTTAVKS